MAGKPCASRLAVNFTLDVDIRLVSGPFQARSMSMDTMMRLKLRAKVSLTFNLARNARLGPFEARYYCHVLGTLVYTMEATKNVEIGKTATGKCDQKIFPCDQYFTSFPFQFKFLITPSLSHNNAGKSWFGLCRHSKL